MARLSDRTVTALLATAAARDAGRPLIEDEQVTLTGDELAARVARAAAELAAAGIGGGDRVALWLVNSIGFVEAFLGVLACGAEAHVLAPVAPAAEIRRALADGSVRALVGPQQVGDVAPPGVAALVSARAGLVIVRALAAAGHAPRTATATDPAFVAHSSGTTGRPQLVVRTHENLWWEAENIADATRLGPADTILGIVPLSHSYGLGNALLASLRTGARLVLRPRFLRRQTLDLLAARAITVFPTVPFMARMLVATDRRRSWDLSPLRLCISAGAPLTRDVYDAFAARFAVPIRQLYGLTEAGDVALNMAPAAELDPTSVGRPIGTVRVTIEDVAGAEVGRGESGEIVVRSASAMGGAEQPLRTHDQGRWTERGDLVITGRTSLFINSAGNKVNPAEVEAALRSHPAVADVAVFGVPARHGDQLVAAVIVANAPCTAEELRVHCGTLLATYKVPRLVSFRDALPRSALGKVLIGQLLAET
ncbi:MAG: acyl--CoA ligase [Deltaproteobacteria bacterium]|nr:acyl--CoA ligase [Deltaproteobacteria bacterium]